ncbi:hypothetical protein [Micromonospora sp. NPDC048830]
MGVTLLAALAGAAPSLAVGVGVVATLAAFAAEVGYINRASVSMR